MAGLTCDYCGEGDGAKGNVKEFQGGIHKMHDVCWRNYLDEQKKPQ